MSSTLKPASSIALLAAPSMGLAPNPRRSGLWVLTAVAVYGVCTMVFAVSTAFWLSLLMLAGTGAGNMVGGVLRSTINPIYATWLTQHSAAKVRATIISMSSQLDAIGQIAGGPIVGVIGTLASLRAALLAAGVLLSPVLLLFLRTLRLEKKLDPGE